MRTKRGTPFLVAIEANGTSTKRVAELSEGTRDQLFLALRLVMLQDYTQKAPALPFIADDLLQTFDDYSRTAHALAALADQGREGLLGRIGVADLDLQECADFGVEGGFPELVRVHLAEALIALHVDAAAAQFHDRLDEAHGAADRVGLVARGKGAGAVVDL